MKKLLEGLTATGKQFKFKQELLRYIEKKKGKTEKEKLEKKHQMLNLIYKRRSKLVHEMSDLGMESKWDLERDTSEPFYRNMGRIYERNGEVVSDNIYELIIPNSMIYDLGLNCINNYLDFCLEEQKHPFENNCNFKRRVSKTWTDKPVQ